MRRRALAAVLGLALAAWIAFDLWGPQAGDLRAFQSAAVARLETDMWRSYYDRRPARLFNQLAALLRTQYHFPLLRSYRSAYRAAKAAFVFKDGHDRAEYLRALPDLERYYQDIRRSSTTPFDSRLAAERELEWWIVHRERARHAPGDLERALADLQAGIYRLPADRFREHARLRAEAMEIRDSQAEHGGVTGQDWQRIEELLRGSWDSLWRAVH